MSITLFVSSFRKKFLDSIDQKFRYLALMRFFTRMIFLYIFIVLVMLPLQKTICLVVGSFPVLWLFCRHVSVDVDFIPILIWINTGAHLVAGIVISIVPHVILLSSCLPF
ncbi:MAG TPA: hypothetical protein O0X64_01860, partial [Methanocorpusculum sp.]|nr:hypothetical protein [Methanocorpusculum sp.]